MSTNCTNLKLVSQIYRLNACIYQHSRKISHFFLLVAADTDDEEDTVEVDVCLRGFSMVPLGNLPAKV